MKRLVALILFAGMLLTLCSTAFAADYEWAFIKKIPLKAKYTEAVEQNGTIEKITYTCPDYARDESVTVEKDLYVYLPYNYDANQEYDILYLMHGAGEDERYWLSEERMGKPTVALLDRMISREECAPTIIVTPTTNAGRIPGTDTPVAAPMAGRGEGNEEEAIAENPNGENEETAEEEAPIRTMDVSTFWMELRNDVIPLIETRYSTYAKGDVSAEKLQQTREHRGFAGFSMGSVTTLHVMRNCLDIISNYGNYSDVTYIATQDAGRSTNGIFEGIFEDLQSEAFKDFPINFWYHGEGTSDYAYEGHVLLCKEILSRMADRVVDGENYAYMEFKGGTHAYNCWLPHLYNSLLTFFN